MRFRTPIDPQERPPAKTAHRVVRVTDGGVAVFACGRRSQEVRLVGARKAPRCSVCERSEETVDVAARIAPYCQPSV